MKILYFGDVFGKPGRNAVRAALQKLVPQHQPDFVVLNGENAAHGKGISPDIALEFREWGVDVVTTGNHAWDQPQIIPFMENNPWVIRPMNYPDSRLTRTPGRGMVTVESRKRKDLKLVVLQFMGRVFMEPIDCAFQSAEVAVRKLRADGHRLIFIDFHAEASSEKQAFMHFMDGKVSAVVGSHAHVQTADERILPGGTAAITDVGMCGCFDSVIGVKKELSIQKFISRRPVKYEPAEGPGGYGAVLIEVDEKTGLSKSILRLRETVVS